MFANLITFIIYAFILLAIADIILYITVKIKERKKRNEVLGPAAHGVSATPSNECSDTNKCP